MPDKPRSLVWGATGFIGGHLVRQLLARGELVRCDVMPDADCDAVYVVSGEAQVARAALEAGCPRVICTATARKFDLPVVFVQPTNVIGPGDAEPTAVGKLILRFLNRRIRFYVDRLLNLIAVEDVAAGYILAGERGEPGHRYVLGHRDVALGEMYQMLAELTELPMPLIRLPALHFRGLVIDDELGLPRSSIKNALARALCWFSRHGSISRRGFDLPAGVVDAMGDDDFLSGALSPPGGSRV